VLLCAPRLSVSFTTYLPQRRTLSRAPGALRIPAVDHCSALSGKGRKKWRCCASARRTPRGRSCSSSPPASAPPSPPTPRYTHAFIPSGPLLSRTRGIHPLANLTLLFELWGGGGGGCFFFFKPRKAFFHGMPCPERFMLFTC
jgi:hypothetical protein